MVVNMRNEQLRHVDPVIFGLTWRHIRSHQEGGKFVDPYQSINRVSGKLRLLRHLGLLGLSVAAGVTLGVILYPHVENYINWYTAKDEEIFRQTSWMYQTPEFKASIDRNLGK